MLSARERTPADEVSSAGVFCVSRAHMGGPASQEI